MNRKISFSTVLVEIIEFIFSNSFSVVVFVGIKCTITLVIALLGRITSSIRATNDLKVFVFAFFLDFWQAWHYLLHNVSHMKIILTAQVLMKIV